MSASGNMEAVEELSGVVGVDAAATGLTTAASDTAAVTEKAEFVVDAAAEADAAEQLPRRGGGDGTGASAGTTRQDSMVVPCGAATTAVVLVGVVGKTRSGEGVEGRGGWRRAGGSDSPPCARPWPSLSPPPPPTPSM